MDKQTEKERVTRLIELVFEEIPRLGRMLAGWPDDPYLAAQLKALRTEAAALRATLDDAPVIPG